MEVMTARNLSDVLTLVAITGNNKAVMNYVNHEDFAVNNAVELKGWPEGLTMQNPSKFGTNVKALQKILDAIEEKKCFFRRIPDAERRARQEARSQQVEAGEAPKRKRRSDAGKKRGKRNQKDTVIEDDDEDPASGDEPAAA